MKLPPTLPLYESPLHVRTAASELVDLALGDLLAAVSLERIAHDEAARLLSEGPLDRRVLAVLDALLVAREAIALASQHLRSAVAFYAEAHEPARPWGQTNARRAA